LREYGTIGSARRITSIAEKAAMAPTAMPMSPARATGDDIGQGCD